MENSITKASVVIIFLVAINLSACQEPGPTVQEQVEALLISAEWNKPSVMVDGVDQSNLYQDFSIKFIKATYTSSGGSPLWPTSGTWVFRDETATALTLDGKMEVLINVITETSLELTVQNDNTTFASGRLNSIKGKNVFKLKKK